jgi:N-acetylglucosaminyldiphosphoundecaprenol N-acetyl-beta-D-mannosaminyltransferase
MDAIPDLESRYILGMRVDATSYDDASRRVLEWAANNEPRYVCISTVHMVMESHDDANFREFVNGADLVTPDGVPLVWGLRLLGVDHATRVYGPQLTPVLCEHAARSKTPVGFYGGSQEVLDAMVANLEERYPELDIAYVYSPPFRPLTEEEDQRIVDEINASGASVLFVGLGCPKQERWMSEHKGRVRPVMLGVGAAFDFLAGTKSQAPAWIQNLGLEWFFRLLTEPRRLWYRYLYHNPRFLALFAAQLARGKNGDGS